MKRIKPIILIFLIASLIHQTGYTQQTVTNNGGSTLKYGQMARLWPGSIYSLGPVCYSRRRMEQQNISWSFRMDPLVGRNAKTGL